MTTDVMRLVCTLKVLLWLAPELLSPLLKVDDSPASLYQHLEEVYDHIMNALLLSMPYSRKDFDRFPADALLYCQGVIEEHPLVFSQLELGRTWRAILLNLRVGASQTRTQYRPV